MKLLMSLDQMGDMYRAVSTLLTAGVSVVSTPEDVEADQVTQDKM
jgi:hypothetical protein